MYFFRFGLSSLILRPAVGVFSIQPNLQDKFYSSERKNSDHSQFVFERPVCELFLFMCEPSFDGSLWMVLLTLVKVLGAVYTINPVVWPIIPHYCNMLATRDLLLHAYSQHEPNPTNNRTGKA
jgi:hypothetical protein